ncbi:MAG: manganese efflux pump [Fermentimonas sp.]|nr:manganese efflux pump [Fermentimonas sp.]
MFLGTYIGKRIHLRVEIAGGVVLIAIGLKILLEHLLNGA